MRTIISRELQLVIYPILFGAIRNLVIERLGIKRKKYTIIEHEIYFGGVTK